MPTGHPLRPLYSHADRFWSQVAKNDTPDECWPWNGARDEKGYGRFNFGAGRHLRASRVAWELTNGPIPDGQHALHRCDNPPCCRPSHLFLGTHADNMADMVAKGRHQPAHSKNPPAARACPDCHRPIDRMRRYCDADRDRRRALTFLEQAYGLVGSIDDRGHVSLAEAAKARDEIESAMVRLGAEIER